MATVEARRSRLPHEICTPCRARKVACDGRRAVCSNCLRLGFSCSYADPGTEISETTAFRERRRALQACQECHARKARCSGHRPACHRCGSLGLRCTYPPTKRSKPSIAQTASSTPKPSPILIAPKAVDSKMDQTVVDMTDSPEDDMPHILDRFFAELQPLQPFSFLHRVTVLQRHRQGLMDNALLLAIAGVTTLLTESSDARDRSTRYITAAERLVFQGLGKQSVIKVQTLFLIAQHHLLMRRFSDAFVVFGIAARMAYGVQLNFEKPDLCFLAQESRRRLMWAIFVLDVALASGLADLRLCPAESIHLQLPARQDSFELDQKPTAPGQYLMSHEVTDQIDLSALTVRVWAIRRNVLEYTKRVVGASTHDSQSIVQNIVALSRDLKRFTASLTPSLEFSNRNLQLRESTRGLGLFLKLHITRYQTQCDLYRLALVGLREALPRGVIDALDSSFVISCQRNCYQSGETLSRIFASMLTLKIDPPLRDIDLPVFAYQCARILLYSCRNYADVFALDPERTVQAAQACLDVVARMPNPSPAAEYIHSDLQALLRREHCPSSPSPEPVLPASLAPSPLSGASRPILSRHSFVLGVTDSNDEDDSESLMPPHSTTERTGSPSASTTLYEVNTSPGLIEAPTTAISWTSIPLPEFERAASEQVVDNNTGLLPGQEQHSGLDIGQTLDAFQGAFTWDFELQIDSFGSSRGETVWEWFGNAG